MPEQTKVGFLSRLATAFWPIWLSYIRRYSWLLLALLLITAFIGFRYGRGIRIDTNLMHLLPAGTQSLERLKQLRSESEIKGFLVVSFEAQKPQKEEDLLRGAAAFEKAINGDDFLHAATERIIYKVPGDFLLRYSLYYAEIDDLRKIESRLRNTIVQAKRNENPYFEDLEQSVPAKFYIGDIVNKYRKRYLSTNAFISNDHKRIAILLSLNQAPDDINFSSTYISRVRDFIFPHIEKLGFKASMSGRYVSDVEKQKRLQSDINQSTTLTLLILVTSLIIFFRSLRVILVIGLPVAAALGYTYHAAWFFIGQISIISSFLTSILLGLGIDYGIHLFARYKNERLSGSGMTQSLEATMRNLFRGLSFGMITTAAVFGTLSFSRFVAFAEFGKIAFTGIAAFFVSFILFFPALVFITERFSFDTTEPSHMLEKTRKTRGWHIAAIVCVVGYGFITAVRPPFEYDFFELDNSLEAPLEARGNESLRILENREHMVMYEFASMEEMKIAEKNLLRASAAIPIEVLSMRDLIPVDASRKQSLLVKINGLLRQAELFYLITLDRDNLRKVRLGLRMTEAPAVTEADIPAVFKQHLYKNNKYYMYIFPKNAKVLRRGALDFAAAYRELCSAEHAEGMPCPLQNVHRGISDLYVLEDILDTVMYDLAKEILLICLVIAGIVLSMTRRLAGVLLILAPLVAGILGLFAIIGLGHKISSLWLFEFNYINLLAIPILLGVGIDNGIYLYSHTRELGLSQVNHIMANTGGSIFISNFTTAMGFLSLAISSHIGLASFGFITFVGMLCIFYAYRVIFPAFARFFEKREAKI